MEVTVACLKLAKDVVNIRTLKWDKVYLINEDNEPIIKRLFPTSLVIPLDNELRAMLKEASLDTTSATVVAHKIHRTQNKAANFSREVATELFSKFKYAVVPMLTKFNKVSKGSNTRYLSGAAHRAKVGDKPSHYVKPSAFPQDAYIQTPTRKLRPICMACSRSMDNLAGKCVIGSKLCYENLIFGGVPTFRKKWKAGNVEVDVDCSKDMIPEPAINTVAPASDLPF